MVMMLIVAELLRTLSGLEGTVAAMIAIEGVLLAPSPRRLTAATLKLYETPGTTLFEVH